MESWLHTKLDVFKLMYFTVFINAIMTKTCSSQAPQLFLLCKIPEHTSLSIICVMGSLQTVLDLKLFAENGMKASGLVMTGVKY